MGVIQRQGIKNIITTYAGMVLGLINLLFLQPRLLSPEELGLTRILFSFSMLISMFAAMGIGSTAVKFLPMCKDPDSRHHGFFGLLLLFPLLGTALATILLYSCRNLFSEQYSAHAALFVSFYNYILPMVAAFAFINAINGYCYALIKTTVPSFLNDVVSRIVLMVAISLYYLKLFSLSVFVSIFAGIFFLQALLLLFYIFYEEKPGFRIDWAFFKKGMLGKIVTFTLIFWIGNIATAGIKEFGTILIGKYFQLQFVAFYSIALFIPSVIEAPIGSMDKIIAPSIAALWNEKKHQEILDVFQKGSLYMLLLGGFLFMNININLDGIFGFLPAGYEQGKWVVLIVSIGTLINMASGPNGTILYFSDHYLVGLTWIVCVSALLFVLQFIFIPIFGMLGAALATALSAVLYNSGLSFFIYNKFKLQPYGKKNLITMMLIVGATGAGYFLPHIANPFLDICYRSSIVSACFLGLVYHLRIIPEFHRYIPFLSSTKSSD